MRELLTVALLDRSIGWWGKLLIFVAGLAALIDLFEPQRLRERGIRARQRAATARRRRQMRRKVRRIAYERLDLFRSFVERDPKRIYSILYGPANMRLRKEPLALTPWPEELTRDQYLTFWHDVHGRLPALHNRCRASHGEGCPRQIEYITKRIDELIAARTDLATHERVNAAGVSMFEGLRIIAPLVFLALIGTYAGLTARTGGPALYPVIFYVNFGFALGILLPFLVHKTFPGATAAAMWTLISLTLDRSASLLDRNRPLHPFRVTALLLFIAGSLLELLVER